MKKQMSGVEYETYCMQYLQSRGYRNIELTKASGDQGVDIIARKGSKKYGIQCKYYDTPVGNASVQQAYAGAAFYNCDVAVVMTNNTFTSGAKDLAEETEVLLWDRITPSHRSLSIPFTFTMRFFMAVAAIILFTGLTEQRVMSQRSLYTLLSLGTLLSSFFSLFASRSLIMNIFTILSDCFTLSVWWFLVNVRNIRFSFPWWTLQMMMLLITLFQLTHLLYLRRCHRKKIEEAELKKINEEENAQHAERIREFLQQKLNCECTLLDTVQNGPITSFTYHTNRTVSLLIKDAENALNQKAIDENRPEIYVMTDLTRRKINVTVSERQTDEKQI